MVARADALALTQAFGIGRGTVEAFSVPTPGAGANFTRTVTQGYWERVLSVVFTFVTSATVNNRQIGLAVLDGDGNLIAFAAANIIQPASQTFRYSFSLSAGQVNAANTVRITVPFPPLFLQPSWQLQSSCSQIDATDQFSAIRGVVERFGIGPDGTPVGETELPYTERGRGYARALESE